MATQLLATKLYIPPVRPRERVVPRPRLIERLNAGLRSGRKLTLISAPAGFGKTTLLSEWIQAMGAGGTGVDGAGVDGTGADGTGVDGTGVDGTGAVTAPLRVAWLWLDERDNDFARFLSYLVAALQTVDGNIGQGLLAALQSAQLPPSEVILTSLINDIVATGPERLVLVLDDYHVIRPAANRAVRFLLERLPHFRIVPIRVGPSSSATFPEMTAM